MQAVTLRIGGMDSPASCGQRVTQALEGVAGVHSVELDFPAKLATVRCTPSPRLLAALVDAVELAGYDAAVAAQLQPRYLHVTGMSCMKNCGSKVIAALEATSGVQSVEMWFAPRIVRVLGSAPDSALIDAVARSGSFTATIQPIPPPVHVAVDGMSCVAGCGNKIVAALQKVPGVISADLHWDTQQVVVVGFASAPALIAAVESCGSKFSARIGTVLLRIEGMSCMRNCGSKAVQALKAVPNVGAVELWFKARVAKVDGGAALQDLTAALSGVGFEATQVIDIPNVTLSVTGIPSEFEGGPLAVAAVKAVPGVQEAELEWRKRYIHVKGFATPGDLIAAVRGVQPSFNAQLAVLHFTVEGMRCMKNCGSKVLAAAQAVPEVHDASMWFKLKILRTHGCGNPRTVIDAINTTTRFRAAVAAEPEPQLLNVVSESELDEGSISSMMEAVRGVQGVAAASFDASEQLLTVNSFAQQSTLLAALAEELPSLQVFPATQYFAIEGMSCMKNCARKVQAALDALPGVDEAVMHFKARVVVITGRQSPASIIAAVAGAGSYTAAVTQPPPAVRFQVKGMSSKRRGGGKAVAAAQGVAGVISAELDWPGRAVAVVGFAAAADVIQAIEAANTSFSVTVEAGEGATGDDEAKSSAGSGAGHGEAAETKAAETKAAASPQVQEESKAGRNGFAALAPDGSSDEDEGSIAINFAGDEAAVGKFTVEGMTCASCVGKVESTLRGMIGVEEVSVSLLAGEATVVFDQAVVNEDRIVSTITDLGYHSTHKSTKLPNSTGEQQVRFAVEGMSCASCVRKIEDHLLAVAGVSEAVVALTTNTAKVSFDARKTGLRTIFETVEALGYTPSTINDDDEVAQMKARQAKEIAWWKRRLIVSLFFAIPTAIIHMVLIPIASLKPFFMQQVILHNLGLGRLLLFICATPVQLWAGLPFARNAFMRLRHGSIGMDFLVTMGTGIAYFYSVIAVIAGAFDIDFGQAFFETSALLLTFVVMGKYLEAKAKGSVSEALTKLMDLQPATALLVEFVGEDDESPTTREIPVGMVQVGDILQVHPGSKVPVDGVVTEGSSSVDEAMLTGESMPVTKHEGDTVFASTLNTTGNLRIRATGVGQDTALSQIVALVKDAQTNKAPIEQFADSVSAVFTPVVFVIAVLSTVGWYIAATNGYVPAHWIQDGQNSFLFSLLFGISVIVIACPCALGLATPTAVMVGSGVGAANGILIKGAAALENAFRTTAIIFDKTGTITVGKPTLANYFVVDENVISQSEYLGLVGSAEQGSEHPIAKALVAAAQERNLPLVDPKNFEAVAGRGLQCSVYGKAVIIGNRQWMEENNVELPDSEEILMQAYEREGNTAMAVAVEGQLVGLLGVSDVVKPESAATVKALQSMGVEVWMVTGDNRRTARAMAEQVGITNVLAEVLPAGKLVKVEQLKSKGHSVAMVGDGINDSPALAKADTGIALGAGTEIAVEAADIVLVRDSLHGVLTALDLSRTVFNRIRMNMLWALGYNTLGIPIAAGLIFPFTGWRLPPELAALAMAFSSVSVVASSLSLKWYKAPLLATHPGCGEHDGQHQNCTCGPDCPCEKCT